MTTPTESRSTAAPAEPAFPPRVAIVVDWLAQFGGAELVIRELLACFPQADLFALFDTMAPADRARLGGPSTRTSWLQLVPGIGRRYRTLLPLMPAAIRSLDLSAYDLIISSHHAVAKGVRTRPGQVHVCYCHSPTRYLWDRREEYLRDHGLGGIKAMMARVLIERVRSFDAAAARDVDAFIVNSRYVGARVRRWYGRTSTVVAPPVDLDFFTPGGSRDPQLYVTASRLVPYKRIDRIVEAFRGLPGHRLLVLGGGPQLDRIREGAAGASNIEVRGEVPREALRDALRRARAFVFAADEDFGIVPLEAQACGTPVIALGKGGALETVVGDEGPSRSGLFFADDAPATIAAAVTAFESLGVPPTARACRANAERFSVGRFRGELLAAVRAAWSARAAT